MKAQALSFSKAPVKFRMYVISSFSLLGFFLFYKMYLFIWNFHEAGQLRRIWYRFDWTLKLTARDSKMLLLGTLLVFFTISIPFLYHWYFFLFAYIYVCVFLMLTITSAFASLNYTQHLIFFTCQNSL